MSFKSLSIKDLLLVSLLLCLFGAAGCLNNFDSADDVTAGEKYSDATVTALSRIIDDNLLLASAPGSIVGIWQRGYEPLFLTNGKADIVSGRKPSAKDHFRMASNTKMFTATAILMLADEKKLSLDDKVAKYLPDIPYANEITIRQLANHTTGLFNYTESKAFGEVVVADPQKKWTPGELVDFAKNEPLAFTPGTKYSYSNTGYIILGMLVEKVSGIKWENFIAQRILAPLDLKDTYCPEDSKISGEYIKGYQPSSGTASAVEVFIDPSLAWAAGSIITTLSDMKTWLDAVRNGTLLSPAMQAERKNWVQMSDPGNYYGFGLMNINDKFLGHTGGTPGYNSFAFTSFDSTKTIIVLVNVQAGATETATGIIQYLFQ
ncbi:MAG: serine hydrolase domain-containing protein [Candidatus Ozemobacteraceae bacterium]